MKLLSFNVNGIRAIVGKSFISDMQEIDFDVICLQETKATVAQVNIALEPLQGYHIYANEAEKKGYSGVATLSRDSMEILGVGKKGNHDPNDSEGRVIVSKHGDITCINTYLPSGSNKVERQEFKEAWMEEWRQFIRPYLELKTPVIVCGDLNIAHTEDDIWNPKGNAKQSGFLPHEREWFSDLLNDGWHDVFREFTGEGVKTYSWWSNRGQARVKDRGWRIDYFLLNSVAQKMVKSVSIKREGGLEISDHAPVILDLEN